MVHANYKKKDISGRTAQQQLDEISQMVHHLVDEQYSLYNHSLLTALKSNKIHNSKISIVLIVVKFDLLLPQKLSD